MVVVDWESKEFSTGCLISLAKIVQILKIENFFPFYANFVAKYQYLAIDVSKKSTDLCAVK